jgi:flagella basal body P-ring formation protein FlgA
MMMVLELVTVAALALTPGPDAQAPAAAAVAGAMADAVRQRLGAGARVDVADVTTVAHLPAGRLEAVPDPDGRIGGRVGFSLVAARVSGGRVRAVRIGRASATVRVWLEQVRVRRFVARGMDVTAEDVGLVRDELAAIPLRRLPTLVEVVGARALRDLPPGDCVTSGSIVLQPVVRTGDQVLATATGQDFQVTAAMVAVQSGAAGAVIRVVNRGSRRTLRARIVSKGVVDITP